MGEISNETWNAQTGVITFQGKNTHPGTAKGIMINSMYAASYFMSLFPRDMLPETTEERVGFVHPYNATMGEEESVIKILLRDFTLTGLKDKENMLQGMAAVTQLRYPDVKVKLEIKAGYLNMIEVLKNYPQLTDFAFEATRRAGLTPHLRAIRGGTDGSRLTVQGLPTPNLFTGGHNFHGKLEFNSRRGLEKSTETLLHLAQVFAEKGNGLKK